MNIENGIEVYISWKATHRIVAPKRYEVRLRGFMEWIKKGTSIESISGDQVIEYLLYMRSEKNYSHATIVYSANILKNFFEFWKGRLTLSLQPKEIIRPKGKRFYRPAVTLEDFNAMSNCLTEDVFSDVLQKLVIHMLWDTGMRVSELCDLNLSSLIQDKEKGFYGATISRRKTLRNNLVLWGTETNRLLILYLGMRLAVNNRTDALFIANRKVNAERISSRTIQRWIQIICDMALIDEHYTPHSFRHGKAHHMLNQRASIRDVQEVLGHSSPISTFHYLSLNQTQFQAVAQRYLDISEKKPQDKQESLNEVLANKGIHSPYLQSIGF